MSIIIENYTTENKADSIVFNISTVPALVHMTMTDGSYQSMIPYGITAKPRTLLRAPARLAAWGVAKPTEGGVGADSIRVYKKTATDIGFTLVGTAKFGRDYRGWESYQVEILKADIGITSGAFEVRFIPTDLAGNELTVLATADTHGIKMDGDAGYRSGTLALVNDEAIARFGALANELTLAADGGSFEYYTSLDVDAEPDGVVNDGEVFVYRFKGGSSSSLVRIKALTAGVAYRVYWIYLEVAE